MEVKKGKNIEGKGKNGEEKRAEWIGLKPRMEQGTIKKGEGEYTSAEGKRQE